MTGQGDRQAGPTIVLVEPQLGENIGAAARAMANFGLSRLRLVKPKQGWPNERAKVMAAGADRILDAAELYDSLEQAIGDCTFVLATTARRSMAQASRRRNNTRTRRPTQTPTVLCRCCGRCSFSSCFAT